MKEDAYTRFSKGAFRAATAIVALGIAAATTLYAKPNSKSASGSPANVVAHVQVSGGPASRMLLVKKNGKKYLLLGLDSSARVAILDVSEPARPRTIDATAGISGAPAAELKVIADTLTLFGTSGAETASSSSPKEIRSLSGVTAFIKDKARGLIYVTNGDGLWIVKTKQQVDADAASDNYGC
jgi:hypothetical protein